MRSSVIKGLLMIRHEVVLGQASKDLESIAYNVSTTHNVSINRRVTFTAIDTKSAQLALDQAADASVPSPRSPIVLCFGGQTGKTVTVSRHLYDSYGLLRRHLGHTILFLDCSENDARAIVNGVTKRTNSGLLVDIACYNGPRSFVLAGNALSITKAEAESNNRSIKVTKLSNSHAYYSHLVDGILEDLATLAGSISVRPPMMRVETCTRDQSWTSFTGEEIVKHTQEPVRFSNVAERIAACLPYAVWLEAGPYLDQEGDRPK
ncbi:hypothetical protein ANO14919_099320 [Xylariales sp. No.14919]|nr:hypothetical protein ANO14919_099320 [Xylariales sp. No.14919]